MNVESETANWCAIHNAIIQTPFAHMAILYCIDSGKVIHEGAKLFARLPVFVDKQIRSGAAVDTIDGMVRLRPRLFITHILVVPCPDLPRTADGPTAI